MSYFEIKTIKGHEYLYLRQSERIGKRVVHKHIAYFGRVDGASRIASGETVSEVRRENQEPEKKPISTQPKPAISKEEMEQEQFKRDRDRDRILRQEAEQAGGRLEEPKRIRIPAGKIRDTGIQIGKERIDRTDREKLLRKKRKKLKKFLRKKIVKKEKEKESNPVEEGLDFSSVF